MIAGTSHHADIMDPPPYRSGAGCPPAPAVDFVLTVQADLPAFRDDLPAAYAPVYQGDHLHQLASAM